MEPKPCLLELLPFAAMVAVQCLQIGLLTVSKAALSKGMSPFIFVLYSNALATLILFPNFIFHRNNRPPITFSVLRKFFLLSFIGVSVLQNCGMAGVNYSSPILASAVSQLGPAFTFILALIFRLEKLDLRSLRSHIKIMGTLVSISGALIVILYKGPPIVATTTVHPNQEPSTSNALARTESWVLGSLFLAAATLAQSLLAIVQALILKEYPSEMTLVFFYCVFGTIQCTIVSLIAERSPNAWKLRPDIELISIIYAAIAGSVVTNGVVAWCIRKKGPVFVAMFGPLGIVISGFMGVIFLGDTLHVGSVVGAIVIVLGFYGVQWGSYGENYDQHEVNEADGAQPCIQKTALLGA